MGIYKSFVCLFDVEWKFVLFFVGTHPGSVAALATTAPAAAAPVAVAAAAVPAAAALVGVHRSK